jgi:membrane protein implicated in regulation of membrane protease activity
LIKSKPGVISWKTNISALFQKHLKGLFFKVDLNLRKIPGPIYLRYTLLNIPELAAVILILIIIQHWVVLPVWLFWSIIGFWIVKDAVLFPFVWRAYAWERPGPAGSMIGARGIARERLAPAGYVKIRGELWRAVKIDDGPAIEIGQTVRIVNMEGLTLFVEPVQSIE